MTDIAQIAAGLPSDCARAIIRCKPSISRYANPVHYRAGDLFPGEGKIMAQGWLRESPLIERYHHAGYLAYRLSPTGNSVRNHLISQRNNTELKGNPNG